MKYKWILLFVMACIPMFSYAQKEVREQLRKGNKQYKQEKYNEAELDYRKALEANAHSSDAAYNLGNSLFRQNKLPEALEQFQVAAENEKDKSKQAVTMHNVGNVFLTEAVAKEKEDPSKYNENLKKSIEAYKQSLRKNPADDETRYNLALAQKLLKDSEDQQNQGQDQKQDQQQKDQQQDQKQEQPKDQQQDQQQQQQQQQNNEQMSKENAQQILDALMQNEKETQEKAKEQQAKQMQRRKTDKNW